ncbi:MAG: hypothetical protein H3Z52_10845 [archaeon]|nr:hypothetical protein [archaeon]
MSKDKRVTTRITKTKLAISSCLILLILFPIAQNLLPALNIYNWKNDKSQYEIQEILSKLPEERVITFAVMGEYYYASVLPLDLAQAESLSLIYPRYTNSISDFIIKLKELNIEYSFLPEDGWLAPWFMRIVKDVPVMQLLLSENFFPIVERSDASGYNLRHFNNNVTFDAPMLITIFAQGERTVVINDRYELERWINLGTSESLTIDISFITPNELQSIESLYLEGQYIVGSHVENLTSNPPYTLSEHVEGLYTLSITFTGSKIEENQIIKISEIVITLKDVEGRDFILRLVSNYDKPLAFWYVPSVNKWGLEQGTFLLYQDLDDFNSN